MKIAISNIAWDIYDDNTVYGLMKKYGYTGLEIAPSRIISNSPYDNLDNIVQWKEKLKKEQGFRIPSMQSIWYGRKENIFSSDEDRRNLIAYTKKAIIFAEKIECSNLVLGCPKNRKVPNDVDAFQVSVPFFRELSEFALEHNTVIGLEAVPTIYNTNFINNTLDALEFIKEVNSSGFKLNLDIGTMIQNGEDIAIIEDDIDYVNHIHISEPQLVEIKKRNIHIELRDLLKRKIYNRYISIEMGKGHNIKRVMEYIKEIFGT